MVPEDHRCQRSQKVDDFRLFSRLSLVELSLAVRAWQAVYRLATDQSATRNGSSILEMIDVLCAATFAELIEI